MGAAIVPGGAPENARGFLRPRFLWFRSRERLPCRQGRRFQHAGPHREPYIELALLIHTSRHSGRLKENGCCVIRGCVRFFADELMRLSAWADATDSTVRMRRIHARAERPTIVGPGIAACETMRAAGHRSPAPSPAPRRRSATGARAPISRGAARSRRGGRATAAGTRERRSRDRLARWRHARVATGPRHGCRA